MRLVLVRHGQTTSNVARILDTALPGPGLTDLGRAQAAALGADLADGAEGPVAGVYCSAARRAQETATLVAGALGLPVHVLEGVHEVQAGALEGRNDDAAIEAFVEVFTRWRDGDRDARFPDGESGTEVTTRFRAAIDHLRARHAGDDTVVVVTHGAALRLMSEMLVGGPLEHAADRIDNCGRAVLSGPGTAGRWTLESWVGDAPGGAPSAHDATTG